MRTFILLFILTFSITGCKTTAESPDDQNTQPEIVDGITATVRYIDIEGGFYGIESDAGESYFPINLAEEYKEDGLRIVFKMKLRTDVMTTVMWGKTVEITEIRKM